MAMMVDRDLEQDSRSFMPRDPLPLTSTELRTTLIDISDEFTDAEFGDLKFFLIDYIPLSKLEKAASPLDLFEMMEKALMFDEHNLDILLEILARLHRYDLVKRLGYSADWVKKQLPNLQKILPFRILQMEIAEDMENRELETLKFLLAGEIKKRRLQDISTVCDLFLFLEKEGIVVAEKPEKLISLLERIKRPDLVERVKKYAGMQLVQQPSNLSPNRYPHRNSNTAGHQQPAGYPGTVAVNPVPGTAHAGSVAGSQPDRNVPENRYIDRSPSAGTISLSEGSESEAESNSANFEIPNDLLTIICEEMQHKFYELGNVLGYTQEALENFEIRFPGQVMRTEQLLKDWQNAKINKGEIASGLMYAAKKLECLTSVGELQNWIQSQAAGAESAENQNICLSIQPARPHGTGDVAVNQLTENDDAVPGPRGVEIVMQQLQNLAVSNGVMHQSYRASMQKQQVQQQLEQLATAPMPQLRPQDVVHGTRVMSIDELPFYPMSRKPRGWCVIINNEQFKVQQGDNEGKEMPPRIGTNKDAESLTAVFTSLDFIVQRHDNLTDTAIMKTLVDTAHNVDHTNFDCLVVCILTHGVLNYLYGANGRLVQIKDITAVFQANRCPTLKGKPKLFFLQACQGRDKMGGARLEEDGPDQGTQGTQNNPTAEDKEELIPSEADFLIGYATVPGYVSFRSRTHGSWYIRKLCEMLSLHAKRHDLISILTEVNRLVAQGDAKMEGGIYKQVPAPLFTLRKKLMFK